MKALYGESRSVVTLLVAKGGKNNRVGGHGKEGNIMTSGDGVMSPWDTISMDSGVQSLVLRKMMPVRRGYRMVEHGT